MSDIDFSVRSCLVSTGQSGRKHSLCVSVALNFVSGHACISVCCYSALIYACCLECMSYNIWTCMCICGLHNADCPLPSCHTYAEHRCPSLSSRKCLSSSEAGWMWQQDMRTRPQVSSICLLLPLTRTIYCTYTARSECIATMIWLSLCLYFISLDLKLNGDYKTFSFKVGWGSISG